MKSGIWVMVGLTGVLMAARAHAAPEARVSCDLANAPASEKALLKAHPKLVRRKGASLEVLIHGKAPGKGIAFKDVGEGVKSYRLINADRKGRWAVVQESGANRAFHVVHSGSGRVEELGGCPLWNPEGDAFVALQEDLEGGSANEASIWSCVDPRRECARRWSAERKVGGRAARWQGKTVELYLARLGSGESDSVQEYVATLKCSFKAAPKGGKGEADLHCDEPIHWDLATPPGH